MKARERETNFKEKKLTPKKCKSEKMNVYKKSNKVSLFWHNRFSRNY